MALSVRGGGDGVGGSAAGVTGQGLGGNVVVRPVVVGILGAGGRVRIIVGIIMRLLSRAAAPCDANGAGGMGPFGCSSAWVAPRRRWLTHG